MMDDCRETVVARRLVCGNTGTLTDCAECNEKWNESFKALEHAVNAYLERSRLDPDAVDWQVVVYHKTKDLC
jgi:hypothetical protein